MPAAPLTRRAAVERHVDDEPVFLRAHGREDGLEHVEGASQVDREHVVPVSRGDFVEAAGGHVGAGVVHQDIDALQAVQEVHGTRVDLLPQGDVERLDERCAARSANLGRHLLEFLVPPADERHLRPFAREHDGTRPADSAARTRHPHNLALEGLHTAPPGMSAEDGEITCRPLPPSADSQRFERHPLPLDPLRGSSPLQGGGGRY